MIDWSNPVARAMEEANVPFHVDGQSVVPEERVELEALRDYVNGLLERGTW